MDMKPCARCAKLAGLAAAAVAGAPEFEEPEPGLYRDPAGKWAGGEPFTWDREAEEEKNIRGSVRSLASAILHEAGGTDEV